jgi:hypothetical protein
MDDGKPPGIGPMGNTLPAGAFDSNALPWGSYGSNRGIERLLDVLVRTRIRASVMTSGILAQRFPQIVRAIAEAGHEIVAHSWAQDIIPAALAPEEVRADIPLRPVSHCCSRVRMSRHRMIGCRLPKRFWNARPTLFQF